MDLCVCVSQLPSAASEVKQIYSLHFSRSFVVALVTCMYWFTHYSECVIGSWYMLRNKQENTVTYFCCHSLYSSRHLFLFFCEKTEDEVNSSHTTVCSQVHTEIASSINNMYIHLEIPRHATKYRCENAFEREKCSVPIIIIQRSGLLLPLIWTATWNLKPQRVWPYRP